MPTARRQRTLMASPTPRLAAWYDAGTLALSDTNAVAAWEDTSRLSSGVAQATGANQPLYKNNGTDNINSLPVVEFDGTNDTLTSSIAPTFRSAFTIFVVARSDTTLLNRPFFGVGNSNPLRVCALEQHGTGLLYYEDATNPFNAFNAGYLTANTPYLISLVKNKTSVKTYVNGVLKRTDVGRPAIASFANIAIGSEGTGSFYSKHLAELRIYSGAMSDAQRQAIERELNVKYALF